MPHNGNPPADQDKPQPSPPPPPMRPPTGTGLLGQVGAEPGCRLKGGPTPGRLLAEILVILALSYLVSLIL